jgi:hypothetical protein
MKLSPFCLGLLILSVAACKQNRKIEVYPAAKEGAAAPQPGPAKDPHAGVPGMTPGSTMPGAGGDPHAGLTAEQLAAVGSGGGPQITDTPPAHWKKQALSPMRLASYLVQGEDGASVDISVSTLRRAPGGLLANINRWRDQLGQPPLDEAALKSNSQTLQTSFGDAIVVDIEGLASTADAAKDGRMLGAIAEPGDNAWFFKMRGNAALVAAEKANFMQWVPTVKAAAPATPAAVPPPASATGAPAAPAPATGAPAAPAPAAAGDGSLTWQVPEGWTLAPAASSMRYATFAISAADGSKGELAVTHFGGNVGGDLDNVNRWRQQVGLPAVDQAGLAPLVSQLSAGTKTLSVIDATGPKVRVLAGWTRHGADTWFFKFTGPDALIGAEKAKFTTFLGSVRFTQPEK